MVFQHFNLFEHLTAQQNVTLALEHILKKDKETAKTEADVLLKEYGLYEYANQYPSQLSGGQKQRLALVRTLATKPKVICLDEPASALDPRLTKTVAQTIKDLMDKDFIVIVATHDLNLLEKLNGKIYLMQEGAIVETASTADFSKNPNKFGLLNEFLKA